MKQLTITRLTETGRIAAVQVPTILNEAGIAFQPIDKLNWSEYPYKPKVEFRIAHTGHSLLLHYRVTEQSVRAVAESDNFSIASVAFASIASVMLGAFSSSVLI